LFKAKREIGNDLLIVEDVSFSYGDKQILKNLSISFNKDDKIALIGPNGIGKTTLLKLLVEELKAQSGTVKWGATVQVGYFPQDVTELISGDEILYDWLRAYDKQADLGVIRNCLGRMLFTGEQQEKAITKLSGGEKHRMWLSKLMLEGGNFLILDEPNNHLDLEAIIALGEGLREFSGAAICVTHDRELIDAFANRIIELKPDGSVVDFKGSYEEYVENYSTK
jgi:ATPase subunit of ABC transporter with duplicated ATPase domains